MHDRYNLVYDDDDGDYGDGDDDDDGDGGDDGDEFLSNLQILSEMYEGIFIILDTKISYIYVFDRWL